MTQDTAIKISSVYFLARYIVKWQSNTDFNKGAYTDTVIDGAGDSAYVRMYKNADNSNDIPFTTPANYTYDAAKIEVTAGVARLKSSGVSTYNWTFTTPGDYTYNGSLIEVTGGVAKLIGIPIVPYAWWHLNETSGTSIADSSGNGRNGTTFGSPSWVAAKLNNGLLTSTSQYGNMGDIASFERTVPFSIEMWIKTTSIGTAIGRRETSGIYRGWDILIASGKVYFYFANTTVSNMISVNTTFAIDDGVFHHLVVTYDGSSNASGVNFYIDGVLKTKTIQYNTLSATTITSIYCHLGARGGSNLLAGTYDEVIIYNRVITATEVTTRYNSGSGTETMIGSYSLTNPTIYPNTGYVYLNPTNFTETATKPSGSEIKYHCSEDGGATWKYWTGSAWAVTDNSYTQANTALVVNTNINLMSATGTFKFRALLHSDSGVVTPALDNIKFEAGALYPAGDYEISMNTDIQPALTVEYLTTTETVSKPTNTDIKYQYSINSGSTYNGTWLTEPQLETALQEIVCTKDGNDKIRFKMQLSTTSDTVTPTIDNLNITSNGGYKISGNYESNIYTSAYSSLEWGVVNWTQDIPIGCALTFTARASNYLSDMGSYGSALINNEYSNVIGKYFQWKCSFSGTVSSTPKLNDFSIKYTTPSENEVNP